MNKTCKLRRTRKSQVSFLLVKAIPSATTCYSKLSVFFSRFWNLRAHFYIKNECEVVFPHFFVASPKLFHLWKNKNLYKFSTSSIVWILRSSGGRARGTHSPLRSFYRDRVYSRTFKCLLSNFKQDAIYFKPIFPVRFILFVF